VAATWQKAKGNTFAAAQKENTGKVNAALKLARAIPAQAEVIWQKAEDDTFVDAPKASIGKVNDA